jgi:hypothetical protein
LAIIALGFLDHALEDIFPAWGSDSSATPEIGRRVVGFIVDLIFIAVFAVLALRLWRNHSFAAAAIGLILRTFDGPFAFREPSLVGSGIWLLMLLLSIHGVRGVQAMRRAALTEEAQSRHERLQSARNVIASLR